MVLWVLLNLEFQMVSFFLLASWFIAWSPVSVVLVVLRDWFIVEDHKTQENYMYKNQDNMKSHEKYQPWESGKPGITESHRAKETKRTWEPQVTET